MNPNLYASYEQITEKFNRISIRINSLLASEARVQELLPEQKHRVELAAGLKCYYKIPSFGQPVPLRIRLVTYKGFRACHLYISQAFERPTREISELAAHIKAKELSLSFKGDRKERFNKSWIYLTFECEREFAAGLMVGFGKVKLYREGKGSSVAKELVVKSDNEEKKEELVKAKKVVKLVPPPSVFKSSMHSRAKTSEEVMRHRVQVKSLKEEREDEDMCHKILKINKRKVNRLLDDVMQRKREDIEHTKQCYKYWIVLSRLIKMARLVFHKQKLVRQRKELIEIKLHKLTRIYVFLKSRLGTIEPDFSKRARHRLTTYPFAQP